jgi:hypothetical protein
MDRLSRVQTPAATIDYVYDALGRRIQRSEGTDTVNYHYYRDTDLVDYRTDETGTLTGYGPGRLPDRRNGNAHRRRPERRRRAHLRDRLYYSQPPDQLLPLQSSW